MALQSGGLVLQLKLNKVLMHKYRFEILDLEKNINRLKGEM